MKTASTSTSFGIYDSIKVFSKIYNAFYCSRKREGGPEHGGGGGEEEGRRLEQQWFDALSANDVERVKQLLETGVDANICDQHGWCALHLASWNGHSNLCSVLLTTPGVQINSAGPGQSTPLTLACQRGHDTICAQLIAADCNVNTTATLSNNSDITPLHMAAQNGHSAIVRRLIAAGAVVNATMTAHGVRGVTALHLAVESEHMDVMDVLIEAGCDVQSSTQCTEETTC